MSSRFPPPDPESLPGPDEGGGFIIAVLGCAIGVFALIGAVTLIFALIYTAINLVFGK